MRKITGGERVGNNLFHSFEEFSIPEGIEAIFENGLDLENIFIRITGSDISVIDGLLKTAGGANFFLINPNGIVFGENAQLDIGGSFIATTANRIEFADGTNWHAAPDEAKVTLTISVPIGLRLDGNNGSITVNGSGEQITNTSSSPVEFAQQPTGLSANDGRTLALVGNGLNFNGGVVTTEGGNIYLNSVSLGSVEIGLAENEIILLNNDVTKYQDIALNQQSLLYSFDEIEGTIFLIGKNINLSNGSFILSQNSSDLSGGALNVNAKESLTLSGKSSDGRIFSAIRSDTLGTNTGKGANINISANQLVIQDAGRIQAGTYNNAESGNIEVNISNLIQLNNASISTNAFAEGEAGNIQLSTSQLEIIEAGFITSSTFGTGEGNGGDLNINANSIEIIGGSRFNRSNISSTSFNAGNAGNLIINTAKLKVKDGASISTSSFGIGDAGNLTINASESISVSGINNNLINTNNPQSRIRSTIEKVSPAAQQAFGLPAVPPGNSGNLTINTPALNISQEGVISVENQGTGNAGRVNINADTLNLDEAASITAAASSGIGGDIILNTDSLNISNDSQITATADSDGNDGNITINTANLTAKKTIK